MVLVGPSAVHLSLAVFLPPNTDGGIASPVSVPPVDGTGISCASSLKTQSEPSRPTLGLLVTPEPSNSAAPDPSFMDTTVAGVDLPPETSAVVSGAGDAALPSEVAAGVNDGSCPALLLGAAAEVGAGAH